MNKQTMTLKKLEGMFRGCKASANQLSRMLEIAKEGADLHRRYIHYTSRENFEKIAESNEVLLTKCTSKNLDDWHEANRFGKKDIQDRLYFMSFSYGTSESVPFWRMYCQPDETAMCFSVTGKAIKRWVRSLKPEKHPICVPFEKGTDKDQNTKNLEIEKVGFTDILYAGIREGDSPHHNAVEWNGICRNVNSLDQKIGIEEASGVMKDYEWHFEKESRLYVILKEPIKQDQVSINLPEKFFRNAHVRLGPWLDKKSFRQMKEELLSKDKNSKFKNLANVTILKSVLTGALEHWKESR